MTPREELDALRRMAELEARASGPPAVAAPTPAAPAAQPSAPVGALEAMFGAGSPIARTIKGAVVDPALAVNQLLASTGLFGQGVKQGATQIVRDVESATQQGRARVGSEGFDPYQLLGGVISPVNKLVGVTQAGVAPGISAALARSAGTGAALSALQPVNAPVEQFAEKKLEQMATGAVLGPLFEGGVKGVTALAGLVRGMTPAGRQEFMQKQLNALAGPDRDRVIESLRDAGELVKGSRPTAAEALSDIPSALELIAAQRKLASQPGTAGVFAERGAANQAARVRALQDIAGTEADRVALAAERGAVTGPMRETALDLNDVVGSTLNSIDKQANQTVARLIQQFTDTQQGIQQALPAYRIATDDLRSASKSVADSVKKAQIDSLEQSGVFPLLATDITKQIDKALKGTVSDTSRTVLQAVRDKVLSKADSNGIISSRDLYENVRKMSNQDIAKLLGLGDQYASGGIPQQAASALSNVKKLVDASLNKSSDGLWSKYLNSYADYSGRLDRMEIGNYLTNKLQTPLDKEMAGVFATAVENAAGTIKKSTGIPRFDKLSDVLTPKEVGAVNGVVADLRRASKADELARKIGTVDTGMPNLAGEIPSLLNRTLTVAKAALEHLQKGNAAAFNKQMAELMLEPGALAQFMTTAIPKSRINEVTSSMLKLMDPATRTAFTQSFVVPAAAQEVGAAQE